MSLPVPPATPDNKTSNVEESDKKSEAPWYKTTLGGAVIALIVALVAVIFGTHYNRWTSPKNGNEITPELALKKEDTPSGLSVDTIITEDSSKERQTYPTLPTKPDGSEGQKIQSRIETTSQSNQLKAQVVPTPEIIPNAIRITTQRQNFDSTFVGFQITGIKYNHILVPAARLKPFYSRKPNKYDIFEVYGANGEYKIYQVQ